MKATKRDLLICSLFKPREMSDSGSTTVMKYCHDSCESCLDFYEDLVKSMEEKEKEVHLSSTPKRVFNLKEKEE